MNHVIGNAILTSLFLFLNQLCVIASMVTGVVKRLMQLSDDVILQCSVVQWLMVHNL